MVPSQVRHGKNPGHQMNFSAHTWLPGDSVCGSPDQIGSFLCFEFDARMSVAHRWLEICVAILCDDVIVNRLPSTVVDSQKPCCDKSPPTVAAPGRLKQDSGLCLRACAAGVRISDSVS